MTGAGGGIAKAIADKLVAEGAVVVLSDINEKSLEEAHASYKRDQSTYAVCDVTDATSIEETFDAAALEFTGSG